MSRFPEKLPHYLNPENFYHQTKLKLRILPNAPDTLALASLDFDNFNFINDLFSYKIGDQVLCRLMRYFAANLQDDELFSRLHADHFVFLLKERTAAGVVEHLRALTEIKKILSDILPSHYTLVCSGGIVFLDQCDATISALLDKANFARKQAKGNHVNTILQYDKKMSDELQWRKAITLRMESALQQHEFEMYLQPKVLIKTGQIMGAEALVRWNSKKYGMIYPSRFIPILEQNGFIKHLDFFMLDQVCRFLKQSQANGLPLLPISVNFSKLHIRTAHLVEKIFHIVNSHALSTKLIEIEFTENIFAEDFPALIEIISALKYLGFKVSLDDFGSAYSSLNYLKDLPLDIIKIDKGFLNSSANTDKGRVIIAKIVELIKSLRLTSVMEGVETDDQVDFLRKLSCDLGQGYFYARPMPADAYTEFVKKNAPLADSDEYFSAPAANEESSYLQIIPQEFQMDNWELYILGQNIDMGLMKGYLDGAATVQYVNDRALDYLGYTRQQFREIFHNNIAAFTHPDDRHLVQANIVQLIHSGKPLQFQTRAMRKDGKVIVLQGRASCVMDSQGRPIGLYAFQDVTDELERTNALQHSLEEKVVELESLIAAAQDSQEALRLSEERYRVIVERSDDIMFEWDFATDSVQFSDKFKQLFGNDAIEHKICTNQELRRRIHPDDLSHLEEWIANTYKKNNSLQVKYRLQNAAGDYLWVRNRSTVICDKNNLPLKAVGVISPIHDYEVHDANL